MGRQQPILYHAEVGSSGWKAVICSPVINWSRCAIKQTIAISQKTDLAFALCLLPIKEIGLAIG